MRLINSDGDEAQLRRRAKYTFKPQMNYIQTSKKIDFRTINDRIQVLYASHTNRGDVNTFVPGYFWFIIHVAVLLFNPVKHYRYLNNEIFPERC